MYIGIYFNLPIDYVEKQTLLFYFFNIFNQAAAVAVCVSSKANICSGMFLQAIAIASWCYYTTIGPRQDFIHSTRRSDCDRGSETSTLKKNLSTSFNQLRFSTLIQLGLVSKEKKTY